MDSRSTPLAMFGGHPLNPGRVVYLGFKDMADGVVIPAMVRAICTDTMVPRKNRFREG